MNFNIDETFMFLNDSISFQHLMRTIIIAF